MNEKHRYGTHSIEIELIEVRPQHFAWLLTIDGAPPTTSPGASQPAARARNDALLLARIEIDRLEHHASAR